MFLPPHILFAISSFLGGEEGEGEAEKIENFILFLAISR